MLGISDSLAGGLDILADRAGLAAVLLEGVLNMAQLGLGSGELLVCLGEGDAEVSYFFGQGLLDIQGLAVPGSKIGDLFVTLLGELFQVSELNARIILGSQGLGNFGFQLADFAD